MFSVGDFADVARRFCNWVEQAPQIDDAYIAHRLLAELQLRVLSLPSVEGKDEYVDAPNTNDWQAANGRLVALPIDGYWKVFDVFADNEEPVFCTIADDLADICADLQEGLYFFEQGDEEEAIWRWRFSYWSHWGRHLTGAQTALHQYFADQGGLITT